MPNKGSKLKIKNRHSTVSQDLFKEYKQKYNTDIDYNTFKKIINTCNKEVSSVILNDISGFKLPYNLGFIVVNKFKARYNKPDFKNSQIYNKNIPLLNLHSLGNVFKINWYKTNNSKLFGSTAKLYPFKFEALRETKRALAAKIKAGKVYDSWKNSDFWSKSKIEKTFNKLYK